MNQTTANGLFSVQRAPVIPVGPLQGFPVDRPARVTSTFGPRWKPNEQRFDFHRGVDLHGSRNAPVYAIAPGWVHRVYHEGNPIFPNGGNTLIIRHALSEPFRLHGCDIDRYYALYLHLDRIGVSPGDEVQPGQILGGMGKSGTTRFVHLHFEIRLQTTCSLEYQLNHPDVECAGYGFDPHVHPYYFIGGARRTPIRLRYQPGDPFLAEYVVDRRKTDLERLETDAGIVDFSLRSGFDARSTRALDRLDCGWVRILPGRVSINYPHVVYRFEFQKPPAFIEATDVTGAGLRLELDGRWAGT